MLLISTEHMTRFERPKQLCIYAGLTPIIHQSGTSIKGKEPLLHMIGNTDWDLETNKKFSFVNFHYTRDLWAESYDFDFSGLVNAHYADPRKRLSSNRERPYLVPMDHVDIGHARAMFRAKDSEILYLLDPFEHISKPVKLNVK